MYLSVFCLCAVFILQFCLAQHAVTSAVLGEFRDTTRMITSHKEVGEKTSGQIYCIFTICFCHVSQISLKSTDFSL